MQKKKMCPHCGGTGPFGPNRRQVDGLQPWCRKCRAEAAAATRAQNPQDARARWRRYRAESGGSYDSKHVRYRTMHPERDMLIRAKSRAKQRGVLCTIAEADIVIPTHCPLLGIPLERSLTKRMHAASPSLDRKDPTRGYEPGNVWVISWRANTLRNDATLAELELLVANLRRML